MPAVGNVGYTYIVKHKEGRRVADNMSYVLAESERKTENYPDDADGSHDDKTL